MRSFRQIVEFGVRLNKTGKFLASYTDREGYTISIFSLPEGEFHGREGEMFITSPSGEEVKGGYWMDFPEKGDNEEAYYKKSRSERAKIECRYQATRYKPLSVQFEGFKEFHRQMPNWNPSFWK